MHRNLSFYSRLAMYEEKMWRLKRRRGFQTLARLVAGRLGGVDFHYLLTDVKRKAVSKDFENNWDKLVAERAHLVLLKEDEKKMADRVAEVYKDLQEVEFIPTYVTK